MSRSRNANEMLKGASPFNPGQPVPVEFFTGRIKEIERIMQRGAGQVAAGKPVAMFVQGEYGIGKSSVAKYTQYFAERDYSLWPVYASLAECSDLNSMAEAILKAAVRTHAFDKMPSEAVREFFADYIEKATLFGVTLKTDALRRDAPKLASAGSLIDFLGELQARLSKSGTKGIFLVLDEINGITGNAQFARFLKGLIDTNAFLPKPVPFLLMLCGVEERRGEMIRNHQPVERIFDIITIDTMGPVEIWDFFTRAFDSANMTVEPDAMGLFTHFSAGFPKIMHLIGDAAYWNDDDGRVDGLDAENAVIMAAEEVGKRFVDEQVYKALRSPTYRSILAKVAAKLGPESISFLKSDVASGLTEQEKKKLGSFLNRMKQLKVIRRGDIQGEWIFNLRMVQLYIWLQSRERPE
jgi:hypothetical protein